MNEDKTVKERRRGKTAQVVSKHESELSSSKSPIN